MAIKSEVKNYINSDIKFPKLMKEKDTNSVVLMICYNVDKLVGVRLTEGRIN